MLKTTTPKFSRSTTIRIDLETDWMLRKMSKEKHMSQSSIYREAIHRMFDAHMKGSVWGIGKENSKV